MESSQVRSEDHLLRNKNEIRMKTGNRSMLSFLIVEWFEIRTAFVIKQVDSTKQLPLIDVPFDFLFLNVSE